MSFVVNRREVIVTFPRMSAAYWGWGANSPNPGYQWWTSFPTPGGGRGLEVTVRTDDTLLHVFPSLEAMVKSGYARDCEAVWLGECSVLPAPGVINGQVRITLHDSATIDRYFRTRPKYASAAARVPGRGMFTPNDSVAIRYVSPELPPPDSASRARAAAEERETLVRRWSTYRDINHGSDALWLTVGQSTILRVTELRCHVDLCSPGITGTLATWTIENEAVAGIELLPEPVKGSDMDVTNQRVKLHARASGTTVLHAAGISGPGDTLPSRTIPAHELQRTVRVTLPIRQVSIRARGDTVYGLHAVLDIEVTDISGNLVRGVPVEVREQIGPTSFRSARGMDSVIVDFDIAGVHTMVASLRDALDTLVVHVVPAKR